MAEGHLPQGPKGLASVPFGPEGPKSGRRTLVAEGHQAQAPKGPASTPFGPERAKSCRGSQVAEGHLGRPRRGLRRHLLGLKGPKVPEAARWPKATTPRPRRGLRRHLLGPLGPKSGPRSQVAEGHLYLGLPKRRRFHRLDGVQSRAANPLPTLHPGGPQILFQTPPGARFRAANPLPTPWLERPTAKAFWPEGPKSGRGSLVPKAPGDEAEAVEAAWFARARRALAQASGLEPEACAGWPTMTLSCRCQVDTNINIDHQTQFLLRACSE